MLIYNVKANIEKLRGSFAFSFQFGSYSKIMVFPMFITFAQISNARDVFEIIQFRTVIIPTQIVFMWSLKSSKIYYFAQRCMFTFHA